MSEWDRTGADEAPAPPRAPGWDAAAPSSPSWQADTVYGLVPGQMVFRRFSLKRQLGQGGMGVVWLAQDTKLRREVALKFLPGMVAADPEAMEDLRDECRRCLDLTHPNIVRVYDIEEEGAAAAISMEFVDGATLGRLKLDRPGRCFEARDILPWLPQLAGALDHAHRTARIVHRDLKPANLMVTKDGALKVMDFGIARSLANSVTRVSGRGDTSGTLVYMSPQQAAGQIASPSDDIYSLGATLYELMTGKPPFYQGNIQEQIDKVVPPPMAQRREELGMVGEAIPAEWEEVAAACLEKEAARRPRTAGEIVARLGVRGAGFEGRAVSAERGATRAVSRATFNNQHSTTNFQGRAEGGDANGTRNTGKRRAAAIAAGIVMALVGGTGWWFGHYLPKQEAARAANAAQRTEAARKAGEAEKARMEQERLAREEAQRQQALEVERQRMEGERIANARGGLLVRTEPVGAMARVDRGEGKTAPATFVDLKLGRHRISVSAEGHTTKEIEAEISAGKVTEVGPVVLEALTGTVVVESEPSGASVIGSDGRRLGMTPLRLEKVPVGEVALRLELEGHEPADSRGRVAEGLETALGATLRALAPPFAGIQAGQEMESSIGMKLCWCPAGEFVMGSPANEAGRSYDESQHRVVLTEGFWLGKYEVTQGDFERVMGGNLSLVRAAGSRAPVVKVAWDQAVAFCAKLTEAERAAGRLPEGWEYRLPTEAQWEYGCRAGTTTPFHFGSVLNGREANCDGNYPYGTSTMGPYRQTTVEVGHYEANAWGLHDMHGNVWEWCADWYGDYPSGSVTDPSGPTSGSRRVYRGGSWGNMAKYCRSAIRVWYESENSSCFDYLGFRVAATPSIQQGGPR